MSVRYIPDDDLAAVKLQLRWMTPRIAHCPDGNLEKDKPKPQPSPGPEPSERYQCGNCGYISTTRGSCPRCGKEI